MNISVTDVMITSHVVALYLLALILVGVLALFSLGEVPPHLADYSPDLPEL